MADIRKDYTKKMISQVQEFRQKKVCCQNSLFYGTVKDALETYLNAIEEDLNKENAITTVFTTSLKEIDTTVKDLEKQSKQLITEGNRMTKAIESQKETLKKEKEKFVKLSKDAEAAGQACEKAMQDTSTKMNQAQKLAQKRDNMIEKAKEANNSYRNCVEETNNKIHDFYNSQQPNLLSQFQNFEETSISAFKGILNKYALAFNVLPDAANKFVEFTKSKFDAIDPESDINTFATTRATNGHMPEDIPIEDANGNILFEGNSNSSNYSFNQASAPQQQQPQPVSEEDDGGNESGMQKCNVHVKALYDYTAEADSELSIREGETLVITEKHASGWWFATNINGQSGFVPENFVEAL